MIAVIALTGAAVVAKAENEVIVQKITIAREANWQDLSDTDKHGCLHAELMQVKGNK